MTKKIGIAVVLSGALLGVLALFIDIIPAKDLTRSAMTETFVRIGLYARQNNALPASLNLLPKRERHANRTTDGWNRPLRFEITLEGIVRLTSLGRDGLPGGTGDDADIRRAYQSKRSDGTLWAAAEMWMVEAEIRGETSPIDSR